MVQYKRCGRANCRCVGDYRHGPFFYHVLYIRGKRVKRYVKLTNIGEIQAGIRAFQAQKAERRVAREHNRKLIRGIREDFKRNLSVKRIPGRMASACPVATKASNGRPVSGRGR